MSVHEFCAKAKCPNPSLQFVSDNGQTICTATLPAFLDAENDGFPEMSFREQAASKKASKNLATQRMLEFLQKQRVFKKVMTAQKVCVPF